MTPLVWLVSRRDLGWRRRRFVIAVAAITLVLALTLLLSGFRDGIDVEAGRAVRALGGDAFVVRDGVSGPFTTVSQLDERVTDTVAGMPAVRSGRSPRQPGEAVLDIRAGRKVGDSVELGGETFQVVGLVRGITVWAGVPAMFVTLSDAQQLVFGGAPAATAVVVAGRPETRRAGLRFIDGSQARADLKRPLANAITTIDLLRLFLWIVAAAIVGSVLYISSLERSRDFAVFKAFGTGNADLVGTLVVEAVILAAVSAVAAVAVSRPLARLFPAVISFPARTLVVLPLVALAVGLVGSLAGARRAIVVDPASAFGGP